MRCVRAGCNRILNPADLLQLSGILTLYVKERGAVLDEQSNRLRSTGDVPTNICSMTFRTSDTLYGFGTKTCAPDPKSI
jgi:hypothetical protein